MVQTRSSYTLAAARIIIIATASLFFIFIILHSSYVAYGTSAIFTAISMASMMASLAIESDSLENVA